MKNIKHLRDSLIELKDNYGIVGLKGGTEVEDLSFKEIEYIHSISCGIVPLTIKIGGPEARNDMRKLFELKVEGILAPMIESPYAFNNFIKTAMELLKEYGIRPMLCMNAETITFYHNMDKIISNPYFSRIDSVTVGRGDLSGSMEKSCVDDPEVTKVAKDIIVKVRKLGKKTSVGGKLTPESIMNVYENIGSHRANTRHVLISLESGLDLKQACAHSLAFEIKLYEELRNIAPDKKDAYNNRIVETKRRMVKGFASAAMIA